MVRKVPIPVIVGSSVNYSDIKRRNSKPSSKLNTAETSTVSHECEEVGCELTELSLEYIHIPSPNSLMSPTIPIDTYTLSSDEEGGDEFFDAPDEFSEITDLEKNRINSQTLNDTEKNTSTTTTAATTTSNLSPDRKETENKR